ncbi:RNA repair transcriptional activator RtcR [Endozoicomonas lisbonensis]|uniref:Transcriptional regulatory protein RtcR n=1 Tax=Endozoicomonas lisbonensis TaxID=3120522 RepID=A0ABV2SNS5_9GAMM
MTRKKNVVVSILGIVKDNKGRGSKRWSTWRPNVSLVSQDNFQVDRLELLYSPDYLRLARKVMEDIQSVSPETEVVLIEAAWKDHWDFVEIYSWLYDFAEHYPLNTDEENYYFNITTGTHVNQICMFLISEARLFPARIIQVSPVPENEDKAKGKIHIIDLDLSRYDILAKRLFEEHLTGSDFLKAGIQTHSQSFNQVIAEIERVAIRSRDPVLLEGATGVGKSQLARRIYELKSLNDKITGSFVAVNCATLKGEGAMSALFGHQKGAFTGAVTKREGYLRQAHQGILFLDEIGELGLDEQAMLLHALEEKRYYPVGSDRTVYSDFQLLAGTNRNLREAVKLGSFREDLLARIDLWHWQLPKLKDRLEDLEANIDYELRQHTRLYNKQVRFNKAARADYLDFAKSDQAQWSSNFRDLNASITRMVTLSESGRIDEENVMAEVTRLKTRWDTSGEDKGLLLADYLPQEQINGMDYFDQLQLRNVIEVCRQSRSMAEAGRTLFNVSRQSKASQNDSHRLRHYLQKFGLNFQDIRA